MVLTDLLTAMIHPNKKTNIMPKNLRDIQNTDDYISQRAKSPRIAFNRLFQISNDVLLS